MTDDKKPLGRPKSRPERMEPCQFYLPVNLKARLRKAAAKAGVSMTRFVEEALKGALDDSLGSQS